MTRLVLGVLFLGWLMLIASGWVGWIWAAVLCAGASWCFGFCMGVFTERIVRGEETWRVR